MTQHIKKSLDRKLAQLRDDPSCNQFILADAKDADMAFGLAAPGQSPEYYGHEAKFRSLAEYRDIIRQNIEQGLVDIVLMSVSTSEVLTIHERLFDMSTITPAIRANDTTDVFVATDSRYRSQPARPFRSATLDHAMCGKPECAADERTLGADLGLFSMTFNNDLDSDLPMLEAYKAFRIEAERKGFRHFLEIFDPNACGDHCPSNVGRFIADNLVRALAGVTEKARPIFLKIPYHGPAAMEQIAAYDASLIPGILGGSAGTTFDAFHQLWEARKYGARAALYGRMINNAEHQPSFIQHLRWLADGELNDPAEAVRSYHGALHRHGIKPYRKLADDLQASARASAYGGAGDGPPAPTKTRNTIKSNGQPDFAGMTAAERIAWNRARWDRILG